MDRLSLESRINAEVYNFSGRIGLYANDFRGILLKSIQRKNLKLPAL